MCEALQGDGSKIDEAFKDYINGSGGDFWRQLGDFLIMTQVIRLKERS